MKNHGFLRLTAVVVALCMLLTGVLALAEPGSGTYEGSALGFGGLVTVQVTYENGALTDVQVIANDETPAIGGQAVPTLAAALMAAGNAEIDGVSGATLTSTAVKTAAAEAFGRADGSFVETDAQMTDGVYESTVFGRNARMTVQVVVKDGKIAEITIPQHSETPSIAGAAMERIPAAVVEYQSLGVDVVAGATRTSSALLTAIAECVSAAGGDVTAMTKVPVPKAESGAPVSMNADVVVIGCGGAGLSGAITAAENGSSVIIVEKFSYMGGGTLLSGAAFNAAVEETNVDIEMDPATWAKVDALLNAEPVDDYMAKWQSAVAEQVKSYKDAGSTYLFDSPEFHMLQTYAGGDYLGNPALVESMCSAAPKTYQWLADIGYPWSNVGIASGALWQRSHQTVEYPKGMGFFAVLNKYREEKDLDIQIVYECRADKILMENGRASGIHAYNTIDGTEYTITANKGVLVATGGFAANVEMREEFNTQWPSLGEEIATTNGPYATGDGIEMAREIGADLVDMGLIQILAFAEPGSGRTDSGIGEATNLWVNMNGERFVDETERRDVLSIATMKQPDAVFYCISNDNNKRCVDDETNYSGLKIPDLIEQGLLYKADTLEELAALMGVPADAFVQTVKEYNECVHNGSDPEFGRTSFGDLFLLESGPYYACKRTVAVHHTMGGIKVDGQAHVVDVNGNLIPGLYAAGETTGGYHGGNRLGGNAVMEALTTGRTAGMNLSQESK